MQHIVKMSKRNIFRNKRRSLLAIISIVIAMSSIVFLSGMMNGYIDSTIRNSTKMDGGHIRITTTEYLERIKFRPVTENIIEPESVKEEIMSIPNIDKHIDIMTERITFPVLLQYNNNNKVGYIYSGDTDAETNLFMLDNSIIEGRYLEKGDTRNAIGKPVREIIVGNQMAESLNLNVDDEIKVLLEGSDYSPHIPTLKVVGIFSTKISVFDDSIIQMKLNDAKNVLNTDGSVQQIVIMLKDFNKASLVAKMINDKLSQTQSFSNIKAVSWDEMGGYAAASQIDRKVYNYIYLIISFLGAIIIINIITMVILERRREIGILKSMGFSNFEIMFLFFSEGVILGIIGSVIGTIVGLIVSLYFIIEGLDFSSFIASFDIPMDPIIKFIYTPASLFGLVLLGILITSICAAIPSRRAAKMNAIDAIKSV